MSYQWHDHTCKLIHCSNVLSSLLVLFWMTCAHIMACISYTFIKAVGETHGYVHVSRFHDLPWVTSTTAFLPLEQPIINAVVLSYAGLQQGDHSTYSLSQGDNMFFNFAKQILLFRFNEVDL